MNIVEYGPGTKHFRGETWKNGKLWQSVNIEAEDFNQHTSTKRELFFIFDRSNSSLPFGWWSLWTKINIILNNYSVQIWIKHYIFPSKMKYFPIRLTISFVWNFLYGAVIRHGGEFNLPFDAKYSVSGSHMIQLCKTHMCTCDWKYWNLIQNSNRN